MKNTFRILSFLFALPIVLGCMTLAHASIGSPRALLVEGIDDYSLKLFWVNPDNANLDHINIYLSTLPLEKFGLNGTATGIQAMPNQVGQYTMANLGNNRGTTNYYYIYVTAVDKSGSESAPTATLKRQIGVTPDLTSTSRVSSASIADKNDSGLKLQWTNPSEDDLYRIAIYRSQDASVPKTSANLVTYQVALPGTTNIWWNNGLSSNATYYYRLVAEDVKGNESDPVIISGATLALAPITPAPPVTNPVVTPSPIPVVANPVSFDYRAEWVSQNGALSSDKTAHEIYASPGETFTLQLTLKNIGRNWWYPSTADGAHIIRLGTSSPLDRLSQFTQNGQTTNRVVGLANVVPTNNSIIFSWQMTVPANTPAGVYKESFRPVAEYVKWFGPTGIFWNIIVS
jgi:hypothetical protein